MKILLSYSKAHFDPSKKPKEHKYWGHSSSIIAKTLYEILTKIGQVTYIDSSEYKKVTGNNFDLFIGIFNNFYKILKMCRIKKSIYLAVNMHPRERDKILLKFLLREGISPFALADWDLVNFFDAEKSINKASYILTIGNISNYNSYTKHGYPKSKIKTLNYGILRSKTVNRNRNEMNIDMKRFIYLSSEIGLRKGFDIIYSLFTNPEILIKNFHLDIVGLPTNHYYQKKLAKFLKILGNRVDYHGWIDADSPKFWKIIKDNDFLTFPSLEEGQAGTVIKAISCGVIPIVSKNSGLDFSPLGQMDSKINSLHNLELLKFSLNQTYEKLNELKKNTLEYYSEFHCSFKNNMEEAIRGCLEDKLYPKISIVLPIHNKEETIKPLLDLLHIACLDYKNVEVHIIFDGCKDKSEEIVKNFYKDNKSYALTFENTPDIFETKTNNIGLRKSIGKYCVILQDDNYIFDKNIFFEAVNFLDKSPRVAILGCLSGVNYYPRDTKLIGSGQISMDKKEVYHRQDEKTDPELKKRIFEVDACMRGPLIIRKSFLEKYGYLDETYAPFYMDDMDICFRARKYGYKVYCMLGDIINKSLTVAEYDKNKWEFWVKVISRNADIFYSRWQPTKIKEYLWVNRTAIEKSMSENLQVVWQKIYTRNINFIYLKKLAYSIKRKLIS